MDTGFLRNRRQRVYIRAGFLFWLDQCMLLVTGVPQGSVLDLFCFLYLLMTCHKWYQVCYMFADNTKVIRTPKDRAGPVDWCDRWQMFFQVMWTSVM